MTRTTTPEFQARILKAAAAAGLATTFGALAGCGDPQVAAQHHVEEMARQMQQRITQCVNDGGSEDACQSAAESFLAAQETANSVRFSDAGSCSSMYGNCAPPVYYGGIPYYYPSWYTSSPAYNTTHVIVHHYDSGSARTFNGVSGNGMSGAVSGAQVKPYSAGSATVAAPAPAPAKTVTTGGFGASMAKSPAAESAAPAARAFGGGSAPAAARPAYTPAPTPRASSGGFSGARASMSSSMG